VTFDGIGQNRDDLGSISQMATFVRDKSRSIPPILASIVSPSQQLTLIGTIQFPFRIDSTVVDANSLNIEYVSLLARSYHRWIGDDAHDSLQLLEDYLTQRPEYGQLRGNLNCEHCNQQLHCHEWMPVGKIVLEEHMQQWWSQRNLANPSEAQGQLTSTAHVASTLSICSCILAVDTSIELATMFTLMCDTGWEFLRLHGVLCVRDGFWTLPNADDGVTQDEENELMTENDSLANDTTIGPGNKRREMDQELTGLLEEWDLSGGKRACIDCGVENRHL
jgi:hypothetical protein